MKKEQWDNLIKEARENFPVANADLNSLNEHVAVELEKLYSNSETQPVLVKSINAMEYSSRFRSEEAAKIPLLIKQAYERENVELVWTDLKFLKEIEPTKDDQPHKESINPIDRAQVYFNSRLNSYKFESYESNKDDLMRDIEPELD